jgi:hypothetical protein
LWLLLLVPLVTAAAKVRTTNPEALLRAGDIAYRAGDAGRAAEKYDQAGVRTIEPARAAFNLATAKFRLAQQGGRPEALADAEVAYRCCLEKGNPYRARALFGLGNCLLLRAASGTVLDRATLRAAIDRFSSCLLDSGCEPPLATDARHNRARARLLLLQAPPPSSTSDEEGKEDKKQPDDPNDPSMKTDDGDGDPGAGKQRQAQGSHGGSGDDRGGMKAEGATGPGKVGKLPPVSDDPGSAPLSAHDAAQHLEEATRRIIEDLAAYRRGKGRPAPPGVRDW